MFVAASALKLVSALAMITLSVVDHSRSPRPSVLLNSYLFLTLLLDAAQARTLFLQSSSDDGGNQKPELTYSTIFAAGMALKAGILLLEAQRKSRWVSWPDEGDNEKEHSPEETSGIFSLGVFFWLNRLFVAGYSKVMAIDDLYPLDRSLSGRQLHDDFARHMGGDYSRLKGDKYGLVKVLVRTLKVPLLLPVAPRLALLAFTFCQPFFLEKLLDHLSQPRVEDNVGYGFIGASVLIYSGIAVSTALTWYFHHRTRTMIRSILVTEIFAKATQARIGGFESAEGKNDDGAALTLMSTDMERIRMGFSYLHDIWASIIQAALAAWMLYNRIGVAFVVPIGLVTVCFGGLGIVVRFTGDSQRAWMAGNQKRVGLTATVIASMKNLKISGLSGVVGSLVQDLRVHELAAGAQFRKLFILAALLGFTPMLIGPPLTFAAAQRALDVSRMFTSLSYLMLLTRPLSEVFQSVPQLLSALACLGRIQAYLECETHQDFRRVLTDLRLNSEKPRDGNGDSSENAAATPPIVIENGSFGWDPEKPALQGINTQIPRSSLTIVVGPVGSGKSTLCKALLGETPYSQGSVVLSNRFPHVGYCDQTAFLSNGSLRSNIVGFSPFDPNRYAEVIEATALGIDIAAMRNADMTKIGSDGITLSGGQKQRVSLARALYLHSDLLVLDDVFSGLDADTEDQVFRRVFGPGGLLRRRGTTVVLCTHSIRHLPSADYILALGNGTIEQQGIFDELMASPGYIQRLGLKSSSDSDVSTEGSKPEPSAQGYQARTLDIAAIDASSAAPEVNESRRAGDRTVYKHYVKSMGLFLALWSLFFAALWGFFTNFPTICEFSSFVHSGQRLLDLGDTTNTARRRADLLDRRC